MPSRPFAENIDVERSSPAAGTRRGVGGSWTRSLSIILCGAGLVTVSAAVVCRALAGHLTVNVTTSMPRGIYWIASGSPLRRGSIVVFVPPETARRLITECRDPPSSFKLLKQIVAVPGDRVCIDAGRHIVGDQAISAVADRDRLGRRLEPYQFCGVVPDGRAFVAANGASSLDSRYFGPVRLADLIPVWPLWTFSSP